MKYNGHAVVVSGISIQIMAVCRFYIQPLRAPQLTE